MNNVGHPSFLLWKLFCKSVLQHTVLPFVIDEEKVAVRMKQNKRIQNISYQECAYVF